MERYTIRRTNDEWMGIFANYNVPVSPVLTVDKALNHEQVKVRDMIIEMEHTLGGKIKVPNTPFTRMKGVNKSYSLCPPLLGEHTKDVLKNLLGYSEEKINSLEKEGAILTNRQISQP